MTPPARPAPREPWADRERAGTQEGQGVKIEFFVPGVPRTQGSMRPTIHRRIGRAIVVADNRAELLILGGIAIDRHVAGGLRYVRLKGGCVLYFAEAGQVRGIAWDGTGKACEPEPR